MWTYGPARAPPPPVKKNSTDEYDGRVLRPTPRRPQGPGRRPRRGPGTRSGFFHRAARSSTRSPQDVFGRRTSGLRRAHAARTRRPRPSTRSAPRSALPATPSVGSSRHLLTTTTRGAARATGPRHGDECGCHTRRRPSIDNRAPRSALPATPSVGSVTAQRRRRAVSRCVYRPVPRKILINYGSG